MVGVCMVDLSLASSYIPAFVCILKSLMIVFLGYLFIPFGGLSILGIMLLMDRNIFNTKFIIDVNAVVFSILWTLFANEQRKNYGHETRLTWVLIGIWGCVSVMSLVRAMKFEVYVYAVLSCIVSILHHDTESLGWVVVRVVTYNITVLMQVYWMIVSEVDEPLMVTLMRHVFLLVGPLSETCVFGIILCVVMGIRWKTVEQTVEPEVENAASVLREALASRKEKNSA